MDVGTLITEAQRLAGRVDSSLDERTRMWINEGQQEWLHADPWRKLRDELAITHDGSQDLYLPDFVQRVLWISDRTNKRSTIRNDQLDRDAPANFHGKTPGALTHWKEIGMSPVFAQPTQASTIYFNPLGDENVVTYIQGMALDTNASGTAGENYLQEEAVTCLSGSVGSTQKKYTYVMSLGKAGVHTDDTEVSLEASGGIPRLARLHRNKRRSEYRHVHLLKVPPAGTTIYIQYIQSLPDLVENNQVIHPGVSPEYLKWYAAANLHKAMNQGDLAVMAFSFAERLLRRVGHAEDAFGDQDLRMSPDLNYWGSENKYEA